MSILREQQASNKLPSFKLVELNGMRLINPHQVSQLRHIIHSTGVAEGSCIMVGWIILPLESDKMIVLLLCDPYLPQ